MVDVAECVETLALVGVVGVAKATKLGGEQLLRDSRLVDHVRHGRGNWVGLDGVDVAEGKTQQAIAGVLSEGRGELLGLLNALASDLNAANIQDISTNVTGGA